MPDPLLYRIALTMLPAIGVIHARILLQHYEVEKLFSAKRSHLELIEGIGSARASSIVSFSDFKRAEAEIAFIEKYNIQPLFVDDPVYPRRLLNCSDAPLLLYFRGSANLNPSRVVAIIGTRKLTEYGRQFTEKLVEDLAPHDILVVSGLAYGIDAVAHKSAIRNGLPTIGVLAHGLDSIYPNDHAGLAREMISQAGGLLTEYRSGSIPDKYHFPFRNRIVAGMSDATIVIESGRKGGSMITAEIANSYNRDVFAVPGKTTDTKSAGCNYLIKTNRAVLLTDAADLVEMMNWSPRPLPVKRQRQLFIELSAEEKKLLSNFRENETVHIDELLFNSGLSSSSIAAALLNLELQNVVLSLPGKLYRLA